MVLGSTQPVTEMSRSVGIAARYGLDGTGIESRWERYFLYPSRPGPTQPRIRWVPGLFPGSKVVGAWP